MLATTPAPTRTSSDLAYAGRLRVAHTLNRLATPLNELSLRAARTVVQNRVAPNEHHYARTEVAKARAALLFAKPFERPTMWAAQVIIAERLRQHRVNTGSLR
jgi:hypothetical protein